MVAELSERGVRVIGAPEQRVGVNRGGVAQGDAPQVVSGGPDERGSKDVSGGGRFTHLTMWARNAQGLRNLFRLSTQAGYEGQFPAGKPRMDRELIAQRPEGVIATTGCPSGEIQTRLRLDQYAEAKAAAAAYQEIFGRENYFLELMDHGLDIERDVRDGLLRLARELNIPLLATNDVHYVTEDQAEAHDNLLCIGVGKNKDDPRRFRFNKSHTAGYGLVSYWTAYLKANYPAEYMAALLTSVGDDKDKAAVYLADARRNGVRVLQPDVNESVAEFTAVGDNVRFGLRSVRNVGDSVIEAVVDARRRKGKFTSFADFLHKVDLPALNKRAVESLIKAGAFDSLGHSRKGLTAVHEEAVDAVIPVKKAAGFGQDDLFAELREAEHDGPPFGLDFPVDDAEWPRRQGSAAWARPATTSPAACGLRAGAPPPRGREGPRKIRQSRPTRRPPSRGRAGSAGAGGVRRSRARPRWRSPPRRPRCRSRRCP